MEKKATKAVSKAMRGKAVGAYCVKKLSNWNV